MIRLVLTLSLLQVNFSSMAFEDSELTWNEYHHGSYQYYPPTFNEKVKESIEVKTNPAVRDQDGFGTCYLFATASLLDQLCLKSGTCGQAQQVSVLDILAKTQLGGQDPEFLGLSGGDMRQVGQALNPDPTKRIKLVREECAPYQQIENYNNPNNDFSIVDYPQLNAIKAIYDESKEATDADDCDTCQKQYFKTLFAFSEEMLENLSRAVKKVATLNAFSDFLKEVLIPESCRLEEIELPKFKVKEEHIPTKEALRSKMLELFSNDQSGAITSCTWTRYCKDESVDRMRNCPVESRDRVCGGHAYLLSGFRTICDNAGKCRNQYKVHNSWGRDFNVFNDNGWVSEDAIFKAYKDLGDETLTYIDSSGT